MGAIFCTSNPVILENGGAVLASQGKSTHCQFTTNHQEISQPLNGVKRRSKMKTCNGCEHLRIFKSFVQADRYYFCGTEFKEIGWFDDGEPIPTPGWCPKEEKNVQ